MSGARPRKWMKLDNAAKIYPAAMSRSWNALFRVSAVLSEPVDPAVLQKALDRCMKRFPHLCNAFKAGSLLVLHGYDRHAAFSAAGCCKPLCTHGAAR